MMITDIAIAFSRRDESPAARRAHKRKALRQIIILAAILAAVLAATTYLLEPRFPDEYVLYFQVAEVAVVGFFIIQILGSVSYSLALVHSEQTAKSMKSLVRIAGAIVVIAFITSYLSRDPVIAASISTIAGLVMGFSSMNILSNVIAGMYLAITRPFRIDDKIKVFGEVGVAQNIGMLYTRLAPENGDEMLTTNSSLVTTSIVLKKEIEESETVRKDAEAA